MAQTPEKSGDLSTKGAENRLLSANKSGLAASYLYDPLGRRTKKSGTGVTTAYYLSDGSDEIAEYDTSGNLTTRYVPGPAIDEPIAMVTSGGTKTHFHTNHQGSVIAMSGAGAALIEGPYTYDPYGSCFSGANPCGSTGVPYRFTGRRLDPETGLLYYRARYYDPDTGRFLQTDPVGYTADLNLYTYVGNDPTDETDPTGLFPNQEGATDPRIIAKIFTVNPDLLSVSANAGGNVNRYFYTDKYGWVDMQHFARAAGDVYNGRDPSFEYTLGFGIEITQLFARDFHSAFSYEDLPSDAAGADFGQYVLMNDNLGLNNGDLFNAWVGQAGGRDQSDPATGYSSLPETDSGESSPVPRDISSSPKKLKADQKHSKGNSHTPSVRACAKAGIKCGGGGVEIWGQ